MPAVYRAFLAAMGHRCGAFLSGTDVACASELADVREEAEALLQECDSEFRLPEKAVVVAIHQGYVLLYLIADGRDDGAVYQFVEGQPQPMVASATFAEFCHSELAATRARKQKK